MKRETWKERLIFGKMGGYEKLNFWYFCLKTMIKCEKERNDWKIREDWVFKQFLEYLRVIKKQWVWSKPKNVKFFYVMKIFWMGDKERKIEQWIKYKSNKMKDWLKTFL